MSDDAPKDPRRRASLRGRGWEILRGMSPSEESPQVAPSDVEEAAVATPVPPVEMAAPPEIDAPLEPDAPDTVEIGGSGDDDPLDWMLDDEGPGATLLSDEQLPDDDSLLDWMIEPEPADLIDRPAPPPAVEEAPASDDPEHIAEDESLLDWMAEPEIDDLLDDLALPDIADEVVEEAPTAELPDLDGVVDWLTGPERAKLQVSPSPPELAEAEEVEARPLSEESTVPPVTQPPLPDYAPPAEVESLTPQEPESLAVEDEVVEDDVEVVAEAAQPEFGVEDVDEASPLAEEIILARLAQPPLPDYAPPAEVESLTPQEPESLAVEGEVVEEVGEITAEVAQPEFDLEDVGEDEASPLAEEIILARLAQPPLPDYAPPAEVESLTPQEPESLAVDTLDVLREEEQEPETEETLRILEYPQHDLTPDGEVQVIPQDARIDAARLAPPTAGMAAPEPVPDVPEFSPPDDALLGQLVTDELLQKLWDRIQTLQEVIAARTSRDRSLTDAYQKDLLHASTVLLKNRANYDEAFAIVYRIRADLEREKKIVTETARYKPQITRYLVIMFIFWLALMALEPLFRQFMQNVGQEPLVFVYHPTLFGLLGGLVYAYVMLHKHTVRLRDFDAAYVTEYLMVPVYGVIMGLLMVLIFGMSLVSIYGIETLVMDTVNPYSFFLWIVCFLAGYYQSLALRLLDRIFNLLRGKKQADENDQDQD